VNGDTYAVEDHVLGEPRRLRVVCIGAGATGLDVTYKIKTHLRNIEFQVYEKNPAVGGTWYENKSVFTPTRSCSFTDTRTSSDTRAVLVTFQRTSIR
jgi:cation diffusion facilitator CzcD-associated flavoprotein CzcO